MGKIEIMLNLQQELNDSTNGIGWERGVTNRGKVIDWRRCILQEGAELIDSYPWKHWKSVDAKPDYENIKIETVDIWHFVMSEALRLNKIGGDGDIKTLAKKIESLESYKRFISSSYQIPNSFYGEIERVEQMIANLYSKDSLEQMLDDFFAVASQSRLDLDTLYKLYIGKNILNNFRQNHGYKEGNYIKEWNGVEDNVVMQEILSNHDEITPEELYSELEKRYKLVIGNW